MDTLFSLDFAILLLRLGVAYVFLYAAWKNTENASAWSWTVNETTLLFDKWPETERLRIARPCAIVGMIMMYGGGLSILLGIEPRLGGAAIALFSAMGIRIHAVRREEAKRVAESGISIAWSAYSAHVAAGLKNWALISSGIFFLLAGAGSYGTDVDLLGRCLGLQR